MLRDFWRHRGGNVALMFGLLLVPLLLALGMAVDYLRVYNAQSEMQTELDVALIAAIKKVDNLNSTQLGDVIKTWFATQTRVSNYGFSNITVDTSNAMITARATASIPTTFMNLAGISSVPLAVTSQVAGPATSYLNVYLVLDKSASMMLAATPAGQATMRAKIGCEFACHTGDPQVVNGVNYATNYAFSTASNITLRSDVLLSAVDEVLNTVNGFDPSHSRIKTGLYRLSTTVSQVLAPTASTSAVSSALRLASNQLTSASSTDGTRFDTAMTSLATLVGTAGDGKTASTPLKLVMMITDGVQSARAWVTMGSPSNCNWTSTPTCSMSAASKQVTPLNPAWCSGVKSKGATFAVVYTSYLPLTSDWGYNGTVGNSMSSSVWTTTWGGTMHSGVPTSTTRDNYIPIALGDCATSSDYFMQATDAAAIQTSLNTLFGRYLSSVHLTQ
ncbi:pilus assembly protein TadG-related protein [Devosia sp.]|uniref:pilus assembly protein TadG-related protein n=1 Tax=Devosia sp. TaxID=1871048 RepID=UPI003267E869